MRILIAFGTRPEIIKLAPLAVTLAQRSDVAADLYWSGQHIELADGLFELFGITPKRLEAEVMGQPTLAEKFGAMTRAFGELLRSAKYDWVVVQGDTATAAAAAIAGFLCNVPVAHVEAGLRTGDLRSPWPEEFNRHAIALAASHHFPPTDASAANLRAEGFADSTITITGNTVIDALLHVRRQVAAGYVPRSSQLAGLPLNRKIVLVTGHRRENFGEPMRRVLRALDTIARQPDVSIVFPVHLNPDVQREVYALLGGRPNIHLIEPLQYPVLVHLMAKAWLVVTDSGGIQEEAPSFGLPILITRESTERPEVVTAGFGQLVGTGEAAIVNAALPLLAGQSRVEITGANPFGNGSSCRIIADRLMQGAWLGTGSAHAEAAE